MRSTSLAAGLVALDRDATPTPPRGGARSGVIGALRPAAVTAPSQFPELIAVKVGDLYHFVEVKHIDWIAADGNYVSVHVNTSQRLLHKSLIELEEELLDPTRFVRIHRSTIVNLTRIAAVEPLFHGALTVFLKDGTKLECSRRYRPRLQERVYFMS